MDNIELGIVAPQYERSKQTLYYHAIRPHYKPQKFETLFFVRNTLFKAECSHNKFRAVKDNAEKNEKELPPRIVHVYR